MTPTSKIILPKPCVCGRSDCGISFGGCHCGCGGKANLKMLVDFKNDQMFITPRQFIAGHDKVLRLPIERGPTFKIDGVYCRLIPLTRGQYALVDQNDYEHLMRWKWNAWLNSANNSFYAIRTGARMARVVLGLEDDDSRYADHVNGVTLDNRRANLRAVNNSQNQMNKALMRSNTSGHKGVYYFRNTHKWGAEISVGGKTVFLGSYITLEEACQARRAAEKRYHGEYARVSDPNLEMQGQG